MLISLHKHKRFLIHQKSRRSVNFEPFFNFTLNTTEPLRVDYSRFIKMTKENSQKLQYTLNKFEMIELNMKNQLDLLQTSVEQRKSFRTLSLLINKIKESVEELKTPLDSIMMEKVSSSGINSVMKRQSNLISRLEMLELEVNSLDNQGQLSQSSTRVLDDISCVSQSSRRQLELHQLTPISQNSEQNNMTVKNPTSDVSPPVPPRPTKPSFFLPQGENKSNLLPKFLLSNRKFEQDTRELTEEPVKNFMTVEQINQSMSLLAAPTPASTLLSKANIHDIFFLGNPQSPEHNAVLREQENTFNQFASFQQPNFPVNQTAVIFPVDSTDNQPELFHSSIGEWNQLTSSKLITLLDMPMN